MSINKIVLGLTTIFSSFSYCYGVHCQWEMKSDLGHNEPVLIKRSSLIIPNSTDGILLNEKERFTIACPGNKNTLKSAEKAPNISEVSEKVSAALLACVGGKKVTFDGKITTLKELECRKQVVADVATTTETCSKERGTIMDVGFTVANKTYDIIKVCYDAALNIPIYSMHILRGTALAGAYVGNERPDFKSDGLTNVIPWREIYTKRGQKTNLEHIIGKRVEEFITEKSYLSKGHLAPDADFLLKTWQYASYFYVNVVPQWMSINNGNWKKIEFTLRKLAMKRSQDLRIYTGTLNSLYLPDENNSFVKIYLYGNNVPVPEYIWKLACVMRTKKCIGFITMNNPYASFEKPLCTDICKEHNWFHNDFRNFSKGLTYCCEVNEMMKVIPSIPPMIVNGVLKCPKGFI